MNWIEKVIKSNIGNSYEIEDEIFDFHDFEIIGSELEIKTQKKPIRLTSFVDYEEQRIEWKLIGKCQKPGQKENSKFKPQTMEITIPSTEKGEDILDTIILKSMNILDNLNEKDPHIKEKLNVLTTTSRVVFNAVKTKRDNVRLMNETSQLRHKLEKENNK